MNLITLQDRLKDLSEQQLVSEMQRPSGEVPQFLLLTELNRRKRMMEQSQLDEAQGDQQTVAQDLMAAAGLPAAQAGQMAGAMAPQTDMMGNTAVAQGPQPQAPMQRPPMPGGPGGPIMMREGGIVALQEGGSVRRPPLPFAVLPGDELPYDAMSRLTRAQRAQLGLPVSEIGMRAATARGPAVVGGRIQEAAAPAQSGIAALTATPPIPGIPRHTPGEPLIPNQRPTYYTPAVRARISRALSGLGAAADFDPTSPEFQRLAAEDPAAAERVLAEAATQQEQLAAFDATIAADTPMGSTPIPEGLPPVVLPGDTAPTPEEAQAANAAIAAEQAAAEAGRAAPTGPAGGGAGTGTGTSGAGGAAGRAAPGSFEEFIQQRMESAESDRRRDQWLALAQFGLQLMASERPTLGGAVGEAGAQALESLRGSYQDYNRTMMELYGTREQLAMSRARAAGGGGGGARPPSFANLAAYYNNLVQRTGAERDRLEVIANRFPTNENIERAERARLEADAALNTLRSLGGGGFAGDDEDMYPSMAD